MSVTAVYHWWDEPGFHEHPWQNIFAPLVLSIATLRACNPTIPIVVCYGGYRSPAEFEPYASQLNFEVVPHPHALSKYSQYEGWRHLSRLFDLHDLAQKVGIDNLMYVDADVFWLKNPLPLYADIDKFCFDGHNSGFYYHRVSSSQYQDFYELFQAYTLAAINSSEIRPLIRKHAAYESNHHVFDEEVLIFMTHQHPDLFSKLSWREHVRPHLLPFVDIKRAKMFHANGIVMKNPVAKITIEKDHSRGLLCLLFRELYDNLCQLIDLSDVFTKQELDYYLPKQFNLLDEPDRVATSEDYANYHLYKYI